MAITGQTREERSGKAESFLPRSCDEGKFRLKAKNRLMKDTMGEIAVLLVIWRNGAAL
jgi:hypothetical protein